MTSRVHEELRVYLGRKLFKHYSAIKHTDGFEAQWETPAESQELQVDLAELDVKFSEVFYVVYKDAFKEVALDQLVFKAAVG